MIRPDRIGHVVIKVHDLERSRKFYTEVMGLQLMNVSSEINMAFFASDGRDHHEIAVVEVGKDAPEGQAGEIGLSHIAFRLRDEAHLRAAFEDLKAHEVKVIATVNHGVSRSVYFHDPDGHLLEVYCDNSPEEIAKFSNAYLGTDKLEFGKEAPSFMEALNTITK
jgi:catechol 2,3-dioxygenase